MQRLIRVVRFTFDGHHNARYGTVELLVSDDQRFLRFDPKKLYDGWNANAKKLDVDSLLADDVVENPTTTTELSEEAMGTGESKTACVVRSVEISDEQAVEYQQIIESYRRLRAISM